MSQPPQASPRCVCRCAGATFERSVEGRPAQTGDVVVVDAIEEAGEAQRSLVLELGPDRLLEEVERTLLGASPGDTRTVDVHVRQLRRKLGDASPIVTVWGVGYKVGPARDAVSA